MQPNSKHEDYSTERPKLLLRGLDSLYVSYFLDMSTGKLDWDELAYQKQRVRESSGRQARGDRPWDGAFRAPSLPSNA